ncbi:putative transcription factor NAM family [Rosa chinensis]|uniref:Putative transcription factor NAM family n=1 Tax=Rosa chinensis TaxID=74649 RepID=A0A2P6SJ14_ROSCH|nr:putative transcription factor NAM family [Rosa chinensis]
MSCGDFIVPPGYRFHPTDERLLSDLEDKNQCKDSENPTTIPVIEMCKHEPHELPDRRERGGVKILHHQCQVCIFV